MGDRGGSLNVVIHRIGILHFLFTPSLLFAFDVESAPGFYPTLTTHFLIHSSSGTSSEKDVSNTSPSRAFFSLILPSTHIYSSSFVFFFIFCYFPLLFCPFPSLLCSKKCLIMNWRWWEAIFTPVIHMCIWVCIIYIYTKHCVHVKFMRNRGAVIAYGRWIRCVRDTCETVHPWVG